MQQYKERLAVNDYNGMADILEQNVHPKTVQERMELFNTIATLREDGNKLNGMLNDPQLPKETKDALIFNNRRRNKVLGINPTDYDQEYINAKNAIGNSKTQEAKYIDYEFDTQQDYNKFLKTSGLHTYSKPNQNYYTRTDNGKPVLRVYKTAFDDADLFDSLTKGLNSIFTIDNTVPITIFGSVPLHYNYNAKSYDENDKFITQLRGLDKNHKKTYKLAQKANDLEKNFLDFDYVKTTPANLMVSSYTSNKEAQLEALYNAGYMKSTELDSAKKRLFAKYEKVLKGFSLTNPKYEEIYFTNTKDDYENQYFSLMAPEARGKMTAILRDMWNAGRVEYSAGSVAGKYGTVFTITRDINNKSDLKSGEFARGYQIFVPGLLEKEAKQVIDDVPEAKVQHDLYNRQAFHYDYDLYNGNKLTNFDSDGGAIYDDGITQGYMYPDEVQKQMLKNTLVQKVINNSKVYAQYDNDGYIAEGQTKLIEGIAKSATNIVAEMRGISNPDELKSSEVRSEIEEIFQAILNQLGINEEGKQIR